MVSISDEMIKEIADQLDSGMKCFYHLPTGELISYPDELKMGGVIDDEIWGEDIEKVEENFHEYIPFTAMESHESFQVMEDFIELIQEEKVRRKFEEIILRRKPFQQFKYLLHDYPDLRQQWFASKSERYKEYVKEQIDDYNSRLGMNEEQDAS
ncbi:MAG TPA: UPF0158 family protein [Flavisolibacter sp.]|nr:UPF0158 family protein [Flavisolibacter sp.]